LDIICEAGTHDNSGEIVFAIPDKVDDFRFYYENGKVASAKLADKHDWAATNAPRRKQH
jgi:hypothetical protein